MPVSEQSASATRQAFGAPRNRRRVAEKCCWLHTPPRAGSQRSGWFAAFVRHDAGLGKARRSAGFQSRHSASRSVKPRHRPAVGDNCPYGQQVQRCGGCGAAASSLGRTAARRAVADRPKHCRSPHSNRSRGGGGRLRTCDESERTHRVHPAEGRGRGTALVRSWPLPFARVTRRAARSSATCAVTHARCAH